MIEARLFDFLVSHKALPLTELGVLRLIEEDAAYDVTTNQYLPPKQRITLESDGTESLQPLMRHLAIVQEQSEEQAFEEYQHWLHQLKKGLHDEGRVAIRGLGTFSAGETTSFEAWSSGTDLQPTSVVAHRVIKPGTIRTTSKTSLVATEPDDMQEQEPSAEGQYRWMIGALILFFAGIALIALRSFGIW